MKKTLLLLLVTGLLLSGCNKNSDVTYREDLRADQVAVCAPSLPSYSLLAPADEDYIQYRMMLDDSIMEDCAIYIQNAGNSIDEFGIIKAAGDSADAAESAVKDYLLRRNEEWTGQYLVEEYPKLRDAEYKVIGRYVVYGILSEEDKDMLFQAVTDLLAEN